jgi:enamine deaminase RidA (YjgF/YER057c/UK114 family)
MSLMTSHLELFSPATLHPPFGYSHAGRVAGGCDLLFVAGQVALDRDGRLVGPHDVGAQARQVFENLKTVLAAAGGTLRDLVKLNAYIVDITQLPAFRAVRDQYINLDRPPASTAVQVAALFRPELLIEIEAVAILALGAPAQQPPPANP